MGFCYVSWLRCCATLKGMVPFHNIMRNHHHHQHVSSPQGGFSSVDITAVLSVCVSCGSISPVSHHCLFNVVHLPIFIAIALTVFFFFNFFSRNIYSTLLSDHHVFDVAVLIWAFWVPHSNIPLPRTFLRVCVCPPVFCLGFYLLFNFLVRCSC